jgi:hypothetical protein
MSAPPSEGVPLLPGLLIFLVAISKDVETAPWYSSFCTESVQMIQATDFKRFNFGRVLPGV